MAQRPLPRRLWYNFLRIFLHLVYSVAFRLRTFGMENEPQGSAMVLSNHQSHLDPTIIGVVFRSRLNFLARQTLFRFWLLRWMIESVDAIPIDLKGSGLAGIKETLRRLKRDERVLLFPEGTRCRDGEVGRLAPGFCAVARRTGVPLVPVALDGAFHAWPRTKAIPRFGTIYVEIGPAITPAEVAALDDEALVAEVDRRIRALHATARARRLRAMGR